MAKNNKPKSADGPLEGRLKSFRSAIAERPLNIERVVARAKNAAAQVGSIKKLRPFLTDFEADVAEACYHLHALLTHGNRQ